MKFQCELDAKKFLSEVCEFGKIATADASYQPTMDELQSFLKARSPLVKKLKGARKSSAQKANWRKNRAKMMKGIKAFHKSTAGKRFHKRMGRFLATRITRKKTSESVFESLLAKQGYLKGVNAAKQHLLVELEYFHQLQEQVELEEFIIDYAFPYFRVIEEKIITDEELSDDEYSFLFDITESSATIQKLSELLDVEFAHIENVWNAIVSDLEKSKVTTIDENYYFKFLNELKNKLGILND